MLTTNRIQLIQEKLTESLAPTHLEIIDESQYHEGHPGSLSGAGHFKVIIASNEFTGKSQVSCHRLIYTALEDLMGDEIHAISITLVNLQ
jgi:BolA protein